MEIVTGKAPPPPRRGGSGAWALALAVVALLLLGLWLRGLPGSSPGRWRATTSAASAAAPCPPASGAPTRPRSATGWSRAAHPFLPLPAQAHMVELVGARYCPLVDRVAAHVYYDGEQGTVSVFLLSGPGPHR